MTVNYRSTVKVDKLKSVRENFVFEDFKLGNAPRNSVFLNK